MRPYQPHREPIERPGASRRVSPPCACVAGFPYLLENRLFYRSYRDSNPKTVYGELA